MLINFHPQTSSKNILKPEKVAVPSKYQAAGRGFVILV
jgi:hypothetical protein